VIRLRPAAASIAAWTTGAVAAVGVGLLALSLIGNGLTDDAIQPVTPEAVERAASMPPSTPAGPPGAVSPTASARPTGSPEPVAERLVSSSGGTVVARCTGASVYLVYWSPAQGYRVDYVARGPAEAARVTFEGNGREVKISVSCLAGVPDASIHQEEREDTEQHG
jgi:hypothetical protein